MNAQTVENIVKATIEQLLRKEPSKTIIDKPGSDIMDVIHKNKLKRMLKPKA